MVSDVAKSSAPPGFQRHVGQARRLRNFFERPVAQVAMQQHWLGLGGASLPRVYLRIDVSVSHEQIEPAVVVHVEKRRAPSDQRQAGLAEMRWHGDIFE